MNMARAQSLAADGALIRRKLWDSWLAQGPDGKLRFQLSRYLKEELGDGYEPHATDKVANDWESRG